MKTIGSGSLGLLTDKKKKKTKAEQETAQSTAARFNNTLVVGKIWVAGKDNWGVGAQEGGPPGGSTDQVVPGVATLE